MHAPANKILPFALILLLTTGSISCSKVKEKTKATLTESGKTMGETASEFIQGVSEGVDKSMECEISLSPALQEKGLQTGKYIIKNDSSGGKNNVLSLYLIFNQPFQDTLTLKAIDKTGLEYGRTKMGVKAKADEAAYFDFLFDKRTKIENKSRLVVE